MALPSNKTDICNLALDHLNHANISSIETPLTKTETLCANWYDQSRKSCLRMHTWNFAMKRVLLAQDTTAPVFGYSQRYLLPSDYIRVAEIGECNDYRDYAIEAGYLLLTVNQTGSLKFRYVFNQETVATFDPLFTDLLALELALNLAYPLTGNQAAVNRVKGLRDEKRREAFAVDGQERKPRRRERSRFKAARRKTGQYGSPYLED